MPGFQPARFNGPKATPQPSSQARSSVSLSAGAAQQQQTRAATTTRATPQTASMNPFKRLAARFSTSTSRSLPPSEDPSLIDPSLSQRDLKAWFDHLDALHAKTVDPELPVPCREDFAARHDRLFALGTERRANAFYAERQHAAAKMVVVHMKADLILLRGERELLRKHELEADPEMQEELGLMDKRPLHYLFWQKKQDDTQNA